MKMEMPLQMRNPADKDAEYSKRFWEGQPDGMREAMIENIKSAASSGTFSMFAIMEGFSEKDKEKMSAYRSLAKEIGYEIGPIKLNRQTGTASAEIRKIEGYGSSHELTNRPGEALKEWQLFEEKVHMVDGKQKTVGFNDSEGKYYQLEDDEQLVHIKSEDGADRKTFIRKNGQDIPFETWKQGK